MQALAKVAFSKELQNDFQLANIAHAFAHCVEIKRNLCALATNYFAN